MKELRIVRGTDVKLYVGGTPLFGVTGFTAAEKTRSYDVYEYLRSEPCERIPQGSYHEIRLEFMTLFGGQLPMREDFTLCVADGDMVYYYEECCVTERKTTLKGNAKAVEIFTLKANRMRKAVTVDE